MLSQAGQFSMSPFDVNTRPKRNKIQKIRVYCTCRRPHDGTKMIKCVNCSEWFHPNCLCVVEGHIPSEFFCEFCMTEFDDVDSRCKIHSELLFDLIAFKLMSPSVLTCSYNIGPILIRL